MMIKSTVLIHQLNVPYYCSSLNHCANVQYNWVKRSHSSVLVGVVIGEFDKYHLILRVLFSCFKPPSVITRSLARVGYYGGRFKKKRK